MACVSLQVEQLAKLMESAQLSEGETVFAAGEQGEWFYVVGAGEFGVFMEGDQGTEELIHRYAIHPFGQCCCVWHMLFLTHLTQWLHINNVVALLI